MRAVNKSRPYEFQVPDGYDWSIRNSAEDLLLDEHQPERAWAFVQLLLRLSVDDGDVTTVAVNALEGLLRVSGDHLLTEIRRSVLQDPKARTAFKKIYLRGKVSEFAKR